MWWRVKHQAVEAIMTSYFSKSWGKSCWGRSQAPPTRNPGIHIHMCVFTKLLKCCVSCQIFSYSPVPILSFSILSFPCSMDSPEDMYESGIFISDLSLHNCSREFIMAGSQKHPELNIAFSQVRAVVHVLHICVSGTSLIRTPLGQKSVLISEVS